MGNENMHNYMREDKKLRHTGAQASGGSPVRSSWAFRRDILRGLQSRPLPGSIHLQLTSWQCWSSVAVGRWPTGVCAPCAAVRPPGTPHSLPGHRKEGHLEKLPCTSFILTEVFLLYACIHLRVSSGRKEQDNLSRVMSPSRARAAGQTQQLWGFFSVCGSGAPEAPCWSQPDICLHNRMKSQCHETLQHHHSSEEKSHL